MLSADKFKFQVHVIGSARLLSEFGNQFHVESDGVDLHLNHLIQQKYQVTANEISLSILFQTDRHIIIMMVSHLTVS